MPTYEYRCTDCGHECEVFQKITADPVRKCPECGGDVVLLIGTGSGIIFKKSAFRTADDSRSPHMTHCGREMACCGRETPCSTRPCEDER